MKLPALGAVVAVTWLDSGVTYTRDSQPKKLCRFTTFGVLANEDEDSISVVHEFESGNEADQSQQSMTLIAKSDIKGIVSFREKKR